MVTLMPFIGALQSLSMNNSTSVSSYEPSTASCTQINTKESLITSSIKNSNNTGIISPTIARKTETVSSTITTSVYSSYNSGMLTVNTPSSSLADTSVPTIITSLTSKPITSLIQTHNPTQSTPLDTVTVTKVTSTISTSTSKVETKGWWIFFLIMNLLINDDGSKKFKSFQKFIKTSQKSSFHGRCFQHYYFKIDRKGTRKHRRGKEQSKIK